jgi:starch phosphorylase
VLAGDHLKAASDLGGALIGIGLLYRYGYFRQTIDAAGRQRDIYDRLDPKVSPCSPC